MEKLMKYLISCEPNVHSFSGLFVFALCLVYLMLPVSLDCLSSPYVLCTQCCQFLWIVCLRLMSCVPNVASFSGLVVFTICLVYPMLPVSLDCLHLMSCVPNVASFSGLSILVCPFGFLQRFLIMLVSLKNTLNRIYQN
jgi:hypothetical protein